jgi:hypothetical protein
MLDTASSDTQPFAAIRARSFSIAASQNGEIKLSKRSAIVRNRALPPGLRHGRRERGRG